MANERVDEHLDNIGYTLDVCSYVYMYVYLYMYE